MDVSKQLEFLKPFTKNRNTVGYPTSPLEENQLEEDDIMLPDAPRFKATNDCERTTESSENVTCSKPIRVVYMWVLDTRDRSASFFLITMLFPYCLLSIFKKHVASV